MPSFSGSAIVKDKCLHARHVSSINMIVQSLSGRSVMTVRVEGQSEQELGDYWDIHRVLYGTRSGLRVALTLQSPDGSDEEAASVVVRNLECAIETIHPTQTLEDLIRETEGVLERIQAIQRGT